jgi:glycosyltransferase involved in cell wall biosynthesis
MKKALWIADFSTIHNSGGAQRSDDLIIEKSVENGFEVLPFNYDTNPVILQNQYDVIISANLETLGRIHPSLINYIASHPRHFRLEHDSNRYLHQEARKVLFGSCKGTFFLTNYHYDQFLSSYGDIFTNVEIIPDPIDTEVFFDKKLERSDSCIYTGFMHQLKGTQNFISHALANPESSFKVAAWGSDVFESAIKKLDNVEFYGNIPFPQMPDLYNSHRSMFYQPEFYEPFCRSVGEAILCGMEINANEKIGCLHYFNEVGIDKFREECANAPKNFWRVINESI